MQIDELIDVPAMSTENLEQALNEPTVEEKPADETVQETTEKSTEATPVTEESTTEETTEKQVTPTELEAVIAERESLKRRIENQDRMIARFGTEIGLLRKKSPEEERIELERIRDIFIDEGAEKGKKALDAYNKRQEESERLVTETRLIEQETTNRSSILQHVPNFEDTIDDIASILKEDGVPEASVNGFKVNPYIVDSALLFNLNKRATLSSELSTVKGELEKAKAEIETLKSKPDELAKKIETAAKQKTLTGKTGGAAVETPYGDKLVTQMTSEELDEALKTA